MEHTDHAKEDEEEHESMSSHRYREGARGFHANRESLAHHWKISSKILLIVERSTFLLHDHHSVRD